MVCPHSHVLTKLYVLKNVLSGLEYLPSLFTQIFHVLNFQFQGKKCYLRLPLTLSTCQFLRPCHFWLSVFWSCLVWYNSHCFIPRSHLSFPWAFLLPFLPLLGLSSTMVSSHGLNSPLNITLSFFNFLYLTELSLVTSQL